MVYMFLPIVFLLHCLEEWNFGFPEWAVRHFGPITTRRFYILSHIPLAIIVLASSLALKQAPEISALRFCWIMVLTVIFTNGVFHVASTFLFREYSPGLVTSLIVTMPYSYVSYGYLVSDLSVPLGFVSLGLGSAISVFIVYSLTWRRII